MGKFNYIYKPIRLISGALKFLSLKSGIDKLQDAANNMTKNMFLAYQTAHR